ncbi:MAG: hypothetical protein QOF51_2203 [Chloroflexota bacterium]|jgi:drug/metabolite transporter (DMT)-like permease|nr:hypothetical protein [Chloroflexota bacterium]
MRSTQRLGPDWTARWIAIPIGVAAISTSGVLIRLTQAPPLVTASNRLLWSAAILLLYSVLAAPRALRGVPPRELAWLAMSGMLLGLHFALWTSSLFLTSVASAVLLADTHPIVVAVIALLVLREATAGRVWLGIGLTLLGSATIAGGDVQVGGRALLGDLMAVGASMTFAAYLVIGRHARQRMAVTVYAGLVYALAGIVLTLLGVASGADFADFSTRDVLLWAALVVAPTLGGHTVFNWTLRYLPVSVVGVAILGEPVGTTLLAWLVLGEPPRSTALLGGTIVIAGLLLTLTAKSKPPVIVGSEALAIIP